MARALSDTRDPRTVAHGRASVDGLRDGSPSERAACYERTMQVLADAAAGELIAVSPGGVRYCVRGERAGHMTLRCGRFPEADDATTVLELDDAAGASPRWLDDDRLLLSGLGLVDLRAATFATFETSLPGSQQWTPLGPRHAIAIVDGSSWLLDLDARTTTPVRAYRDGPPSFASITPAAAAAGRLWVTAVPRPDGSYSRSLFELLLER